MSTRFETSKSGSGKRRDKQRRRTEKPSQRSGRRKPLRDVAENAVEGLHNRLAQDRVTRLALLFLEAHDDIHLKDTMVEWMDDHRRMSVDGHEVINFGSDSFLGLDRDPRIQKALVESVQQWGTHNGASRAFSSIVLYQQAERRLADWLGVQETLIFPSVTLANAGLLPAIAGKGDLLVVDRTSHDSIQQAAKIAAGNGATVRELSPCGAKALQDILEEEEYNGCVIAIDGVYSMTGKIPPLDELHEVARQYGGILYVDDAHGTGVVGPGGRGATSKVLGSLQDVLMVGSLSKAFSCMGAFVTCNKALKRLLKIRSNTFIFGGPIPPPYLAAICAVCDLIDSGEFDDLNHRLRGLIERLVHGIRLLGLNVLGDQSAIISVTIGDIERTLQAGKWLFDRGYYVQSATYPAVPIMSGLLRIQVNANHTDEAIDSLLNALGELKAEFDLPTSYSTPA